MAIIDVVKYEQEEGVIIHKFPSCDLRWGSQLVVYPGQVAFFVKYGKVCDSFSEGTYTLKSNNIPLLNKLINIPFGSDSPWQADVWFVSTINRLNLKWGTETPIQLEDPQYGIIVPVRAYGQYGFKVADPEKFLLSLVGNMPYFDEELLQSYFRGVMLSKLTNIIAKKITSDKVSILELPTSIYELSLYAQEELRPIFKEFGIDILLFSFISINIPEDDPSLDEIKKAKNLSARLKITGRENYKLERSFDIMDKAAENESGAGVAFINAGLGLGVATNMGKQISSQLESTEETPTTPPPIPIGAEYYLAISGQPKGPYSTEQIRQAIVQNKETLHFLCWKKGMSGWEPLSLFPEFSDINIEGSIPPPIPPIE